MEEVIVFEQTLKPEESISYEPINDYEPIKLRTESSVSLKLPEKYIQIIKKESLEKKSETVNQPSTFDAMESDKQEEKYEMELLKSVYENSDLTELLNENTDVVKDSIDTQNEESVDNKELEEINVTQHIQENSDLFEKQIKLENEKLENEKRNDMTETYDIKEAPLIISDKEKTLDKIESKIENKIYNEETIIIKHKEQSNIPYVTQIRIYSPSPEPIPLKQYRPDFSKTHRVSYFNSN